MPRVGSSRISTSGSVKIHLASTTFCWLPPESLPVTLRTVGALMRRSRRKPGGDVVLGVLVDPAALGQLAQPGRGHVALDVLDQVEPVALAVLGGVGDAVADGVAHRPDVDLLAVLDEPPGDVLAVGAAEHAHRELGAARAHQPGQPDDLPAPQRKRRVVDDDAAGLGRAVHRPVLDPQHLFADVRLPGREPVLEVAADHAGDDPFLGQPGRVERLDRAAVAQDRDGVGDRRHLVELVRDDHAGDALVAQPAQQVEQVGRVVVVERRGRLVEDQQLHLLRQRLGDLDELLLADAEVAAPAWPGSRRGRRGRAARRPRGWCGSSRSSRACACSLPRKMFSAIDSWPHSASSWWMITIPRRSLSRTDPNSHRSPVEDDLAVVRPVRVDAREHLHQGGLPGAVLPADRVDLPVADGKVDVGQRLDPGEGLGDPAHAEQFGHFS